jgi:hypothetical protein
MDLTDYPTNSYYYYSGMVRAYLLLVISFSYFLLPIGSQVLNTYADRPFRAMFLRDYSQMKIDSRPALLCFLFRFALSFNFIFLCKGFSKAIC